jgi:hypothetical protein
MPSKPKIGGIVTDRDTEQRAQEAGQVARRETQATVEQARTAASGLAGTAREQAGVVASEAQTQAGQVMDQMRERLSHEAHSQTERAAQNLRRWAEDLTSMAESGKPEAPTQQAMARVAEGGRRAADYLDERGVNGLVDEVQEFARRRPGAFLLGAAVTGFVVGRLAKATTSGKPEQSPQTPQPSQHQQPAQPSSPYASGPESTIPVPGEVR